MAWFVNKFLNLLALGSLFALSVLTLSSDSAGVGLALSGSNVPSFRVAWRFDLQSGKLVGGPISVSIPDGSLQQCAITPDGTTAYISTYSNVLNVLRFTGTAVNKTTLTVGSKGPGRIEDIKLNPSGTLLALCGTTFANGVNPVGYLSVLNLKTRQTVTVATSGEFCAAVTFCDDTTLVSAFSSTLLGWSTVSTYQLQANGRWKGMATTNWVSASHAEPPNHLSCSRGFAVATNFDPAGVYSLSVPSLKVVSKFVFNAKPPVPGLKDPPNRVYSLSTAIDRTSGQLLLRNNASVVAFPFKNGMISAPKFGAQLVCPGCRISKGYPYGLSNAAGAGGSGKFGSVFYTPGNTNQLVSINLGAAPLKLSTPVSLGSPTNSARAVCSQY